MSLGCLRQNVYRCRPIPKPAGAHLSWRSLSSPVTYSIFSPPAIFHWGWSRCGFADTGAPATRTREPRTAPPPSTRSILPMPVENRSSSSASSSLRSLAFSSHPAGSGEPFCFARHSSPQREFHAPAVRAFPAQLVVSPPHSKRILKIVFVSSAPALNRFFRPGKQYIRHQSARGKVWSGTSVPSFPASYVRHKTRIPPIWPGR